MSIAWCALVHLGLRFWMLFPDCSCTYMLIVGPLAPSVLGFVRGG